MELKSNTIPQPAITDLGTRDSERSEKWKKKQGPAEKKEGVDLEGKEPREETTEKLRDRRKSVKKKKEGEAVHFHNFSAQGQQQIRRAVRRAQSQVQVPYTTYSLIFLCCKRTQYNVQRIL